MPRRRLPGQSYSYSKHYWPVPSSALLHTENPENQGSPPQSAAFRRSPPPPRTMSPTPAGYLEPPHDGVAPMPRVYTRSRSSELLCYLNRLHCSETGARTGTGQGTTRPDSSHSKTGSLVTPTRASRVGSAIVVHHDARRVAERDEDRGDRNLGDAVRREPPSQDVADRRDDRRPHDGGELRERGLPAVVEGVPRGVHGVVCGCADWWPMKLGEMESEICINQFENYPPADLSTCHHTQRCSPPSSALSRALRPARCRRL